MNVEYIFRNANDSVNDIFKPFWLNDTICFISNNIESELSWYEKMDLSTKVALISLGVSVITFLLGFIVSEAIRRYNKSNELKQYKHFIQEWVYKSNENLEKYIKSLKEFSEKVKGNTDANIVQWRTSMIHLSEISKIPLEKFSDIYLWGHSKENREQNRKELMNFLYQIEYLNKVEVIIKSVYDEYCINNNKIMDEWNANYMQMIDFISTHDKKNIQEDSTIFNTIVVAFMSQIKTDGTFSGYDNWENHFIKPAMILVCNDLDNPIIKQIAIYIRNMKIIKMKHDKLNQYSAVFDSYIENLKKAQSTIMKSIEHFKKQEIKKYCK